MVDTLKVAAISGSMCVGFVSKQFMYAAINSQSNANR